MQLPLCQDEAEVPEGEIANERASEIATPAEARKQTGNVTDEIRTVFRYLEEYAEVRTVFRDLDKNVATPKRKRRRKAGKKRAPPLSKINQHQLEKYQCVFSTTGQHMTSPEPLSESFFEVST